MSGGYSEEIFPEEVSLSVVTKSDPRESALVSQSSPPPGEREKVRVEFRQKRLLYCVCLRSSVKRHSKQSNQKSSL